MLEAQTKQATATPLQISGEEISFEDFLVKYDGQHAEWIGGKVILKMPASYRHQDVSDFLVSALRIWVEAKNAGVIRSSPLTMKLVKEKKGREPDILFVAKKNLKKLKPTFLDGAADLVIEIISPESRARDRGDKFYEYEAAGVKEYWLIDPERRQAEFYGLNKNGIFEFLPVDADGKFRSRVLKNLELRVEWLWQEPLPTVLDVLKEWKLI